MLGEYLSMARATAGVSFLGRLGTYRYLDMDVTVSEALTACDLINQTLEAGQQLPAFFADRTA